MKNPDRYFVDKVFDMIFVFGKDDRYPVIRFFLFLLRFIRDFVGCD